MGMKADRKREQRRERIAAGVCGQCGKRPLETPTLCSICRLAVNARQAAYSRLAPSMVRGEGDGI